MKLIQAWAGILLASSLITTAHAAGETYPTQPVKAIIGWEPGGVTDIAARALAKKLGEQWGQPLVVENRAGGGGVIATSAVARAKPDGYTLAFIGGSEAAIRPFTQEDPYLYSRDFTPIALITVNPIVLAANVDSPYRTVADLRANPGTKGEGILFSSSGTSSTPHLAGEYFSRASQIKLKHIAYKGGAPAAAAVASGEVPLGFMAMSSAKPFIDSGRIRIIGVTTANRVSVEPTWPTLAEQGVQGFDASVWTGLYVRKETPAPIVEKLAADVAKALRDPELIEAFRRLGADPGHVVLGEFGKYVSTSANANEAIIKGLVKQP